jgi:hypothetical protein
LILQAVVESTITTKTGLRASPEHGTAEWPHAQVGAWQTQQSSPASFASDLVDNVALQDTWDTWHTWHTWQIYEADSASARFRKPGPECRRCSRLETFGPRHFAVKEEAFKQESQRTLRAFSTAKAQRSEVSHSRHKSSGLSAALEHQLFLRSGLDEPETKQVHSLGMHLVPILLKFHMQYAISYALCYLLPSYSQSWESHLSQPSPAALFSPEPSPPSPSATKGRL